MKRFEMWKWFKLPVDCELIINADKTDSEHPDSISVIGHDVLTGYHIEKVEVAINSYDANQALISKQAEQIKVLREALELIVKIAEFPPVDRAILQEANKALSATEQK